MPQTQNFRQALRRRSAKALQNDFDFLIPFQGFVIHAVPVNVCRLASEFWKSWLRRDAPSTFDFRPVAQTGKRNAQTFADFPQANV
jgi:hypothetical protein